MKILTIYGKANSLKQLSGINDKYISGDNMKTLINANRPK